MPTITCSHCLKPLESGPTYCPHCFLKLPDALRPIRLAPATRTPSLAKPLAKARGEKTARVPGARAAAPRAAKPAGECPACAHPITSTDTWCKWCHWPVNRKREGGAGNR